MRRALVFGAIGLGGTLALSSAACSVVAGYEDLGLASAGGGDAGSLSSLNLGAAAIYSVYPSIFSPTKNLAGVTAQLPRIHALGFDVLSIMPVTPIGQPTAQHPTSIGSPYAVHDYYAINPSYGTPADLTELITTAHGLGMYVVLDEEINQTSWDNDLLTTAPQFYVHDSDGSVAGALGLPDVAQLDYSTANGLDAYMQTMLASWATTYAIDGFRFLNADTPIGSPTIPQTFWAALRTSLANVRPNLLLWADEEDPELAGNPFALDYGWTVRGGFVGATGGTGLQQVASGSVPASDLEAAWHTASYTGALHLRFLENWDFAEDVDVYGGLANTMAAATFDFTIDGVPMLWNGEEVGNDAASANTQALIDWGGPDATTLTLFYRSLVALRNANPALQQGEVTWLDNSAPSQVVSFERSEATSTFVVVINFASTTVPVTLTPPAASGWSDVSPAGSPGGTSHGSSPASLSLAPFDFAVFRAN